MLFKLLDQLLLLLLLLWVNRKQTEWLWLKIASLCPTFCIYEHVLNVRSQKKNYKHVFLLANVVKLILFLIIEFLACSLPEQIELGSVKLYICI